MPLSLSLVRTQNCCRNLWFIHDLRFIFTLGTFQISRVCNETIVSNERWNAGLYGERSPYFFPPEDGFPPGRWKREAEILPNFYPSSSSVFVLSCRYIIIFYIYFFLPEKHSTTAMYTLWKEVTPSALQWENPQEAEYSQTWRSAQQTSLLPTFLQPFSQCLNASYPCCSLLFCQT